MNWKLTLKTFVVAATAVATVAAGTAVVGASPLTTPASPAATPAKASASSSHAITAAKTTVASSHASAKAHSAPAAAPRAVGAPFSCLSEEDFLSQGEPDTQLYESTYGAGEVTYNMLGSAQGVTYNALGYDPNNDYLYATDLDGSGSGTAGTLYQIDSTGTATSLGVITGYTVATNQPAAGAFDASGNYWITGGNGSTTAYEINVSSSPPAVIDKVTLSPAYQPIDITWLDGYMWGLSSTTMYRIDLSTGTVSTFAAPSGVSSGNYGADWTYTNGTLGFSNNGNGDIYRIAVATPSGTPTFTLLGSFTGPVAGASNDGAACIATGSVDLAIVKTGPAVVSAGGAITWTLTVTNDGPNNSSGFAVTDDVPSGVTNVATTTAGCTVTGSNLLCSEGVLDDGGTFVATLTGTAPATFTSCITNTATVTGNENDPDPANGTSSWQTCPPAPAITVTKSVTSTGPYNAVGQTVAYQFVAKNTGNVALTSVGITDSQTAPAGALATGPTCTGLTTPSASCSGATTSLAVGQSATFTGTYTITQADLNNGAINDSATASGTPPTGSAVTSTPSTATVSTTSSPALTVAKTVTSSGPYNAVGQTITYQFVAKNTGNVSLTAVGVTDTQTAPAGALATGPTCTGLTTPTASCSGATTSLVPGQSATFTGTYLITQADLNNGTVKDSATASGTPPTGSAITSLPSTQTVNMTSSPALTVAKTVTSSAPYNAVGQTISYQFVAKNTGNVTLTGVAVTDSQTAPAGALASGPTCTGLTTPTASCSGSATTLVPGQSATFTGTYLITQADLDNGTVKDSATVTGTPPTGSPVTSLPSTQTVNMTSSPSLTVAKTVTSSAPYNAVGQTISYQFVAKNTGNVTLSLVGVTDTQTAPAGSLATGPTCTGLTSPTGSCSGSTTTLAPGQSATFTGTYLITQADLNTGTVKDSATASGTPPTGSPVTSTPSTQTVTLTSSPALTVTKSVTSSAPYNAVGQTISYQFVAKNTGDVTLTGVSVTDSQTAPAGALATGPTCTGLTSPTASCSGSTTTLAPGQSATFTGTYLITQADLNNGSVSDSATSTGTPPTGSPITSTPSTATVSTTSAPALTVTKTVTSSAPYNAVGQTISYQFVAKNTGNVSLTAVSVTDTQTAPAGALATGPTCTGLTTPTASCSGSTTTLVPGQSATFTGTYLITQADLNNGSVSDSATTSGSPPTGSPITSTPSTATVSTTPLPALTVTKTVTSTGPYNAVGQTISYQFVAKNTGNVNLTSVGVTDTQTAPAGALATGPTCTGLTTPTASCSGSTTTLVPGQSATFTGTYLITQADLNTGTVKDSATASGTPPTGSPVTSTPSTQTVTLTSSPALTVTKSVTSSAPYNAVGQTISYQFVAKNTGNVTLTGVSVTDSQTAPAGALATGPTCTGLTSPTASCSGSTTTLAPGQSATFTGTYLITQADLNNGSVSDSATSTGTPPTGSPITSTPSTATVSTTSAPALTVTKTVTSSAPYNAVGQTISYQFVAKNTGNVTLTSVGITDSQTAPAGALATGPTCTGLTTPTASCSGSTTTLVPGQSATFTGTYLITQADLNNGSVSDSATTSGSPPTGSPITSTPSTATVSTTPLPAVTVTKTVTSTGPYNAVGQTISYQFVAKNTGNVNLTSVGVTDTQTAPSGSLATGPTCTGLTTPTASCSGSTTTLVPGQSATFTGTYLITQADLNNGTVKDSATASGTPPTGSAITSLPSTQTVNMTSSPALTVAKTVTSSAPYNAAGQTISYQFVATNTGNVTLSSVGVTDTQTAPAGALATGPTCTGLTTPTASCSGSTTTLVPGQSATFTGTYLITQADLNNGTVKDSATASGTPPTGSPVTSLPSTQTVNMTSLPALTVAKTVTSSAPYNAVGQTISYQFLATNTGNVTLTSVGVTDTQAAPAGALATGPTCTGLTSPTASCSGSTTTLVPGQSATFTGTYLITQADLNTGTVKDSATASGTPPTGSPVASLPSTQTVNMTSLPALTVAKTVTSSAPYNAVGQTISYQFVAKNTGNVTLTSVGVTDTQTAPAVALTTGPTCTGLTTPTASCSGATTSLVPGQSATFTATYLITQADLDNGTVKDSATASGTPPTGSPVTSLPSTQTVNMTSLPALTVTKTVTSSAPYNAVGQTISYQFVAKNSGNVTLTAVGVTDSQTAPAGSLATGPTCTGLTTPTASCSGSTTTLAPGQSATFTGTYLITQADLNNGTVKDSATASGTPPTGSPVTSLPSTQTVSMTSLPAMTVTKTVTSSAPYNAVGQTIGYQFVATNTGNVTLTSVGVTDSQTAPAVALTTGPTCTGLTTPTASCSGSTTTLAPGQSATFTGTYTITQADLNNGSVNDSATTSGTPPTGSPVTSTPSTATVPTTSAPALTVTKTVTSTGPYSAVGQTISYQFVAKNTGNVTLTSVAVADSQTAPAGALTAGPTCTGLTSPSAGCSGSTTTLVPGQSATFTGTYTITQADLNNGTVKDSATASGTPPTGSPVTSLPSTQTVTTASNPALTVAKTVTSKGPYNAVGQTISYQFVATNTGNVTLSSVGVTDTQTAPAVALTTGPTCTGLTTPTASCSGATTSLVPGQSATFTGTYLITQADLNNGSVSDSATSSGSPPTGSPISSTPSTATVPTTPLPALTVTKTVTSTGPYNAVGQTISYQFVATNTGNVTLSSVGVTDTQTAPAGALASGPTCTGLTTPTASCSGATTSLVPGQSATFTGTYLITQADLNTGTVKDSATASGTPPTGSPVTSTPSTQTVTLVSSPALTLAKTVTSSAPYNSVGQTISYQFVATNTGNVTLGSVGVTDTQTAPAGALATGPTCVSLSAPSGACSGSTTTLAPGQSATFTGTYLITQADLNNGNVKDSATASGTPPTGSPVTSLPSTQTVSMTSLPAMTVAKTVTSSAPYNAVGQTITYQFVATNTGNVTLSSVGVTDSETAPAVALTTGPTCTGLTTPTAPCSGSTTTLVTGQSATFTATYLITQADLNNGSVSDSATTSGTPPSGPPITSPPSTATVTTTSTPGLIVTKTVTSKGPYNAVGQTISYQFVATNTGNVTLTSVGVADSQSAPAVALTTGPSCASLSAPAGSCSGATTALAPGQSATFTGTYTITQADLDNGSVSDSATTSGTPPSGPPITSPPSTATVTTTSTPGLIVTKTVTSKGPYNAVGQTINYQFVAINSGNVTLTGVNVTDTQTAPALALTTGATCVSLSSPQGTCSGATTTLVPGQSAIFTGTYTITQADLNNGSVGDSATSSGTPPSGPPITSPPSTITVTTTSTPSLTVTKTVTSKGPYNAVGQTISYQFVATNTGNVTLTGVSVSDTQTAPALALTTGPTCAGLSSPQGSCSGSTTTLTPGQSATFTGTYLLTQADLDNGLVGDSATSSGTPPSGPPITSPPSMITVTTTSNPALTVTKTVTSQGPYSTVGQTISYQFLATNTGNVTLTGVSVTDAQTAPAVALTTGPTCVTLASPQGSCSGATTSLSPGQSATFTGTYLITQADLNKGSVNDSATTSGTPPSGPPTVSPPSTVTVTTTSTPALTVTKTVTSTGPYNTVGQTISYQFVATNTGNVSLSSVSVTDTQTAPAGALTSGPTCVSLSTPQGTCSGTTTNLVPGQSATFTGTYKITQADLNNGAVKDAATASGTPPTGSPVTSPPSTQTVTTTSSPALTVTKTVTSSGPYNTVGQTISYQFLATNTGNVTLTGVSVTDAQTAPAVALTTGPTCVSLSSPQGTCSGASTTLAPGQSAIFTGTYKITQADLNFGSVGDAATSSGTPPTGPPITSPPSPVTITTTSTPALTVTKTVTSTGPYNTVGQTISYQFVAKNTGNVSLTGVSVTDAQTAPAGSLATGPTCVSLASPQGSCSGSTTGLAPGQSATFTGTYTITQADLDNGSVKDAATASGTPPSGPPVTSPPSTATVTMTQTVSLSVVKSSPTKNYSQVGAKITYDFLVTNTGKVTVHAVSVKDTQTAPATQANLSAVSCPSGTLAPGASETCTATYTVTKADLTNGAVHDAATASAEPPQCAASSCAVTSKPSAVSVPAFFAVLTLVKSAATLTPAPNTNDTFTLVASNAGPSNSGKVTVTDDLPAVLAYVSSTTTDGSVAVSGQVVTWTIPNLTPSGQASSASVSIVVTVNTTVPVSNTGTFTETTPNGSGGFSGRSNTVTLVPTLPPGYRLEGGDGGVFDFGPGARYYGSVGFPHPPGLGLHIFNFVGMSLTANGYWLVEKNGGIFSFGAKFYGSLPTEGRNVNNIIGIASTPDGGGYWMVSSNGTIYPFGDAIPLGSLTALGVHVNNIVAVDSPDTEGFWMVASNGDVYSFGNVHFYGSCPIAGSGCQKLDSPIVGMTSPDTGGYWLVASDGGVFTFGDAHYHGSCPAQGSTCFGVKGIIGIASPDPRGYWMATSNGSIYTFGDANFFGSCPMKGSACVDLVRPIFAVTSALRYEPPRKSTAGKNTARITDI